MFVDLVVNNSCTRATVWPALAISPAQAQNWTLDELRSTPNRRFMKTHANIKDLPAGAAKGLKVVQVSTRFRIV